MYKPLANQWWNHRQTLKLRLVVYIFKNFLWITILLTCKSLSSMSYFVRTGSSFKAYLHQIIMGSRVGIKKLSRVQSTEQIILMPSVCLVLMFLSIFSWKKQPCFLMLPSILYSILLISDPLFVAAKTRTAVIRSSHQRCSFKKDVLKNFTKFTETHLCQSLFFNKVAILRLNTSGLLLCYGRKCHFLAKKHHTK